MNRDWCKKRRFSIRHIPKRHEAWTLAPFQRNASSLIKRTTPRQESNPGRTLAGKIAARATPMADGLTKAQTVWMDFQDATRATSRHRSL
jgi:hypothetical protein